MSEAAEASEEFDEEITDELEDEVIEDEEETDDEEDVDNELEDRARSMGWVPTDEFRGDPKRHISAEEFVRRGENELPIMRERYRKIETELKDQKKLTDELVQHYKDSLKKEREASEQRIKQLKAERSQAISEGEGDEVNRIDDEIDEEKSRAADLKEKETQPVAEEPESNPVLDSWVDKHDSWFDKNKEMTDFAVAQYQVQMQNHPNWTDEQRLEAVDQHLKKHYPGEFTSRRRQRTSNVEGGAPARKPNRGKKTYNDLPAEAKAACDRFVKEGVMEKDDYVKDYFAQP